MSLNTNIHLKKTNKVRIKTGLTYMYNYANNADYDAYSTQIRVNYLVLFICLVSSHDNIINM